PRTPVIAISPRKDVIQRLTMAWGVFGMQNPLFYNTDVLLQDLPQMLKNMNVVESGDTIVITAGIPISQMRPTNMTKINRIPSPAVAGQVGRRFVQGLRPGQPVPARFPGSRARAVLRGPYPAP